MRNRRGGPAANSTRRFNFYPTAGRAHVVNKFTTIRRYGKVLLSIGLPGRTIDLKSRHVPCSKICTVNTHLVACGRGGGPGVYPLAHFSPHSFFAQKKNGRCVKSRDFSLSAPPHRPPQHHFSVDLTKDAARRFSRTFRIIRGPGGPAPTNVFSLDLSNRRNKSMFFAKNIGKTDKL